MQKNSLKDPYRKEVAGLAFMACLFFGVTVLCYYAGMSQWEHGYKPYMFIQCGFSAALCLHQVLYLTRRVYYRVRANQKIASWKQAV